MHFSAESMPGATLYVPLGHSKQPSISETAPCFIPCFPGGQEMQPLWSPLTKDPLGHCLQSRDAASAKNDRGQALQIWPLFALPAGQVEQYVAPLPSRVTVALAHKVHTVAPEVSEYVPTSQLMQDVSTGEPTSIPYFPGEHLTHFVALLIPGTLLYVPAVQLAQPSDSARAPSLRPYFPAEHAVHPL